MKKFSIAAAAALALASAAPAIAEQKTSDDPFVSTQGAAVGGVTVIVPVAVVAISALSIAASGDS